MTDSLTANDQAKNQHLFRLGVGVLVALMTYYLFRAKTDDMLLRIEGLVMLFLALLPSILWAKSDTKPFPLIEVFFLMTLNSYALPLLNGHSDLKLYPNSTLAEAAGVVITYQVCAFSAYRFTTGFPKKGPFWTEELLSADACRYLNYGMLINTLFLIQNDYFDILPGDITSIARAICFGIGIVCIFVVAQLWGAGQLNYKEKAFFLVNIAIQTVMQLVTLFLVGAISALVLFLLGYVTKSKKIPIGVTVSILLITALLHNGKADMRDKYWNHPEINSIPAVTEIPAFFSEWISHGISPNVNETTPQESAMTSKLIQRTSLFQMVSLVVYDTPDQLPFMFGETYSDLLAQFVPRFLWPDKPSGLISTSKLSIYYQLQSEESAVGTTIAFGQVSEAYANFGIFGVAILGTLYGIFYKKVQLWTSESPRISYAGTLLVILVAWSFQNEWTLSVWVASLYQASLAILALLYGVKTFVK